MAVLEFPWDPAGVGTDFFDYIKRQWPHYQTLTLELSLTWSATKTVEFPAVYEGDPPEIECEAQTRTDTSSGTCAGTITWNRQSSADEISEQAIGANEFSMGITLSENPSASPRIDSALYHHINELGTFTDISGTWSQTLYTGDACDIIETTTGGDFDSDVSVGTVGVYESGTKEWFSHLSTIAISFTSNPNPMTVPTLDSSFLTSLGGPPEGADIVFSDSGTSTTGSGGWSGSCSLSYTLTLST